MDEIERIKEIKAEIARLKAILGPSKDTRTVKELVEQHLKQEAENTDPAYALKQKLLGKK